MDEVAPGRPPRRRPAIQSLARGLRMIEDLVQAERPLRLRDFVAKYGIDRASAFRFLATLEAFGVAGKDPATKAYTRGSRLLAWAAVAQHERRVVDLVRPHLLELARVTGESGHTAVLSADQALLVDYVPAAAMITVRHRVGVHEPLHCTAVGKALLAFLAEPQREALLGRLVLARHTARTIDSAAALRRELARVRRDGVAVDHGEYDEHVLCIAAPLVGREQQVLGSIGISLVRALAERDPGRLRRLVAEVKGAGARAAAELAGARVDHEGRRARR